MKLLENIIYNINIKKIIGIINKKISNICIHSSKIIKNSIFVALKGTITNGHKFIKEAIKKGAKTIIFEDLLTDYKKNITYIKVNDSSEALGIISANFYDHPSKKLKLIGITGTNGKTTSVILLHNLFLKLNEKSALLSTIYLQIGYKKQKSTNTTPNSIFIQKFLYKAVKKKCKYAFMEISSHGIDQKRHIGLNFFCAIFSNISHDHLDYHKNFKNYLNTKKSFFDNLSKNTFVLINKDDKYSKFIFKNCKSKKYTYSFYKRSDYKGEIIKQNTLGTVLNFNKNFFSNQFIGKFNAYNLLVVYSTAMIIGKKEKKVINIISKLKPIKGRFENFYSLYLDLNIIVDYAHTPDALEKTIKSIKEISKKNQRILCVFGCGGDRDKKKRPIMTNISCKYSDIVILTSDNPRNEDPEKIINDMERNIIAKYKKKILRISERELAIKKAIELSKKKDIILIAGKGHEIYQEIKGIRYPFNDIKIAKKIICIKESKI